MKVRDETRHSATVPALMAAAATVLIMVPGGNAEASMVDINVSTVNSVNDAQTALANYKAGKRRSLTQTFEDFTAWDGNSSSATSDPLFTDVGIFVHAGQDGTGNACVDDCDHQQVANSSSPGLGGSGRTNTSAGGSNWLDSNDTEYMGWFVDASGIGGKFSGLAFFLSDVSDVGATLDVEFYNGVTGSAQITPTQPNGTIHFVTANFGGLASSATVSMMNTGNSTTNDGFGIDDATVAVPLPGTLALLGAGLLGLAGFARRRLSA